MAAKSAARQAAGNGLWNAGQQLVTSGLNAILGIVLILYLDPAEVGTYNYITALVAVGTSIMVGGLNGLGVKYLLTEDHDEGTVLATIMLVRQVFGLLSAAIIIAVSLTSGSPQTVWMTVVASTVLLIRTMDAPELWFLANLRSRSPASVRIVVGILMFAVRFVALSSGASVQVLIGLFVLEAALVGGGILFSFIAAKRIQTLRRPSGGILFAILRDSWPLVLSGFVAQVTGKIGIIYLQAAKGPEAVAVFTSALRLTELSFLLPTVFMTSTLPLLLRAKKGDPTVADYQDMLRRSFGLAFLSGVVCGFSLWTAGTLLITFVFGEAYAGARSVLTITALVCPFVFSAAVYSKWIIAEGFYKLSLLRHFAGAIVAVCLTLALVEDMGVAGAAIGWAGGMFVSSYASAFIGRRSRATAVLMTVAPVQILIGSARKFSRARKG